MYYDIKGAIADTADELAIKRHDCGFYDLTQVEQETIYKESSEEVYGNLVMGANYYVGVE